MHRKMSGLMSLSCELWFPQVGWRDSEERGLFKLFSIVFSYFFSCNEHTLLLSKKHIYIKWYAYIGASLWLRWSRICLQCRRPWFDPWIRKIPWRRKWPPTPVLLPGESHGQRSLEGYRPWGRQESDTTEWLTLSLSCTYYYIRRCKGNKSKC